MGISGRRRLAAILGAAGLAAVLAAGGCGSGQDRSTSNDSAPAGAPAGTAADSKAGAGTAPNADAGQPGSAPPVAQRAIIYTGSMTVRVDDVDRAASRATAIVTGVGGFVGGDKRSADASSARASLELRVPADRFQRVVDQLAGLGRPEQRDLNTQDVTEETVDLDARITTQRARVDSGRRLLAQAKTLSDLVMLEGEVAKREADLASLEARKRRLADLTALSTITVELLGPDAQPVVKSGNGFLAGLRGGWTALLGSIQILLTVLGALLPFAVALGLPAAGIIWWWRRTKARRSARVAAQLPVGMAAGPVHAGTSAGAVPAARGPMPGSASPGPVGQRSAAHGPVGPGTGPPSAPDTDGGEGAPS